MVPAVLVRVLVCSAHRTKTPIWRPISTAGPNCRTATPVVSARWAKTVIPEVELCGLVAPLHSQTHLSSIVWDCTCDLCNNNIDFLLGAPCCYHRYSRIGCNHCWHFYPCSLKCFGVVRRNYTWFQGVVLLTLATDYVHSICIRPPDGEAECIVVACHHISLWATWIYLFIYSFYLFLSILKRTSWCMMNGNSSTSVELSAW